MTARGKVVPFERPAAYWAVRARRHRAPDRRGDKARLLRKALEKSNDPAIALELAGLYADMDCCTAAERYLLQAVLTGGLTGDVCFLIACCALTRGDQALGEEALDASLRLAPEGRHSERAQELLENYPWAYDAPKPGTARSDTLCCRAREALAAGRRGEALEAAKLAWRRGKTRDAAWLLGAMLPPEEGEGILREGLRLSGGMPEGRFSLAEACGRLGKEAEARRELEAAFSGCDTLRRCEGFCLAAWRAGCPDLALRLTEEKLRRMPGSVEYLRLKYLCLKRLGRDAQAKGTLEALLEIDPDDAAALWYRRHPGETHLDAGSGAILTVLGAMVRSVPGRLRRGPLNRLLHMLTMMLAERADIAVIYRAVPPAWRKLSPAEKRALDDRRAPALAAALAAYALLAAGKPEAAAELIALAPGRKRALRLIRRLAREERSGDALHQF